MATEHPAWLTTCYMQKVLQNAEKDESIEVSGITVTVATAAGDNYSSEMHRAIVKFSRLQNGETVQEKKSLIVKSMLRGDGVFAKMAEDTGCFPTELSMMSVTLPRMNEILGQLSPTSLGARCFHVHYEKPTHIVFEDLALEGFRMANRYLGLDLDHCLLAIRDIGKFHASSITLKEKDPMAFRMYKKGTLHKNQPRVMAEFFNSDAKALANEIAKWPELSPRIAEKLVKLSGVMFQKGCEAALFENDDFNVLNHGDLWVNNMLFRYDERQKPINHIFVDFQYCHYGSPAVDLLYFFGTSPADEVRLHHRELLLREYHTSLTSTMTKLNCNTEIMSFDQLQAILEKRAFCEVFSTIIVMNEYNDADNCVDNGSYRQILIRLLPFYDSKGLLDV